MVNGCDRKNGIYSVPEWTEILGISDDTFRRWLRKYDIPYRKPNGGKMYVDAVDLWSRIPTQGSDA